MTREPLHHAIDCPGLGFPYTVSGCPACIEATWVRIDAMYDDADRFRANLDRATEDLTRAFTALGEALRANAEAFRAVRSYERVSWRRVIPESQR